MAHECLMSLRLALGRELEGSNAYDRYQALALAVRRRLMNDWLRTEGLYRQKKVKYVHYFSLEFLAGRMLQNAVLNLDVQEEARSAGRELGMVLEDIYEQEHEPGLGNGGLGRLAACFLDSLATQRYPACGYGIRYEHGIFRQDIRDGYQVESPDSWLLRGNPWETPRPDEKCRVKFYGRSLHKRGPDGHLRVRWVDTDDVWAIPYETLIPGFRNGVVNPLILWSARSTDAFNLNYFNHGDYLRAVAEIQLDETISKVLYPSDNTSAGRELRLKQQAFFVSASLQRILTRFLDEGGQLAQFPDKAAIHLNDTHPTIAVPELMRLLLDEHGLRWETAWDLTTRTFAYTNHTLMPEALEKWDSDMLRHLLPRHFEIICEINRRFLDQVRLRWPGETDKQKDLSIFEEGGTQRVRMANLAIVGSHAINGVAKLHTDLLKRTIFREFHELWPKRFLNVTNGVAQRRWLYQANPALSRLITEAIGDGWITELEQLTRLVPLAEDASFRETWLELKCLNAQVLATLIKDRIDAHVDPYSLFDMQVKRIHEYKRQLLNILRVLAHYLRIREAPHGDWTPRTVLIAGKAAPGYAAAKLIIKLANDVSQRINSDPVTSPFLKLLFLPNYGVSLAERIFPASDLSEQISTAGTEASGTGNMKFALNGALTIGTMDGANIEICDAVGRENMFVFGLTEPEVAKLWQAGYDPREVVASTPELGRVIDFVLNGGVSPDDPGRFAPLINSLLDSDHFLVLADFASYLAAHDDVDRCYRNQDEWARKSILNVANIGRFSSDRAVHEYATSIWGIKPLAP